MLIEQYIESFNSVDNIDVPEPTNEGYDFEFGGFETVIGFSEANIHAINIKDIVEQVKVCNALNESAIEEADMLLEASIKGFFEAIANGIKKFWAKVQEVFKTAALKLDRIFNEKGFITRAKQMLSTAKFSGKKVKINDFKVDKLSDYISKINVVLFNPDDLRFIKDSPSIRRNAINLEISQLNNVYLKNLNMYNKLLKQRNSYLKTMNINANSYPSYLEVLTDKLIEYGEKIYNSRKKYIDLLNDKLGKYYKDICDIDNLKLEYSSDYKNFDKDSIINKYKDNLNRDIILGKTSFGVHHDDIKFKLDKYNIKDYGSEGQQKNAIIAYKLAELEIFKQVKGNYPILILDDLFSELDINKINNILNLINDDIQTFITVTEIDKINSNNIKKSKLFKVNEGNIGEE